MKRWRWVGLLLIVLLLALQAKLWISGEGMRGIHALHQRVDAQQAQNTQLHQRNQALEADVRDLKQGNRAVEARARENLGLIKPGEVFYQVIGPAPAATTAHVDASPTDTNP